MDPTQKWSYFEEQWTTHHPDWITTYKEKVARFWKTTYKPKDADLTDQEHTPIAKNSYVAHLQLKKAAKPAKDEYRRYLSLPPVDDIKDIRKWWMEETQQLHYPNSSKMALDLLSIPAMSADAERLFSGANLQHSKLRNRLKVAVLEQLECLKSWMKLSNWTDRREVEEQEDADNTLVFVAD